MPQSRQYVAYRWHRPVVNCLRRGRPDPDALAGWLDAPHPVPPSRGQALHTLRFLLVVVACRTTTTGGRRRSWTHASRGAARRRQQAGRYLDRVSDCPCTTESPSAPGPKAPRPYEGDKLTPCSSTSPRGCAVARRLARAGRGHGGSQPPPTRVSAATSATARRAHRHRPAPCRIRRRELFHIDGVGRALRNAAFAVTTDYYTSLDWMFMPWAKAGLFMLILTDVPVPAEVINPIHVRARQPGAAMSTT